MPLRVAEIVDEGALDGQSLAAAGVGVDLQLEAVLLALAGGGLVVDDREPLLAVRLVDDHVRAADHGAPPRWSSNGRSTSQTRMEVVLPLGDVAIDELPRLRLHLPVRGRFAAGR